MHIDDLFDLMVKTVKELLELHKDQEQQKMVEKSKEVEMLQRVIVNDIPDHFQLGKDTQLIASVLGGLLSTVVSYAKDSCIWLSAKLYGNVILVHVKNSNGFNCNAIENQLQQLQAMAGRTRGTVGFTSHDSNITSVTFGFSNLPL